MRNERCYHIGFGLTDLSGPTTKALLCGDPERARQIAQETEGVICLKVLSENRGLNSYLCELENGCRFIAATSGMGAPSLSIVVNELVQAGIKKIIRVGTCGGIAEQVKVGSVVISQAALCLQGAANDIAPRDYPAAGDPFTTVALAQAAQQLGLDYHVGLTASVDTFYEGQERSDSANPVLLPEIQGRTEFFRRLNILNYEMEAGTLFKMALVYGFSAGCVCAVLAERVSSEQVMVAKKRQAEINAIKIALHTIGQAG